MGPSVPLPSMVCDMPFFKVKLVQEGLPIKQVVKRLRSNFKESWPTSKETAGEPEGDPACDECETQNIVSFSCPWLGCPWSGTVGILAARLGNLFFIKLAVIFIPSSHIGPHLGNDCLSTLLSLGDQVGEHVAMPQSLDNHLEGDREKPP